MSKQQIASILRDPDFSTIIGPKTLNGIRPNGTAWYYGIHCESQFCGTDGPDKMVEVFFSMDDRAEWIVPHGINTLREIGSCCDAPNKSLDASGGSASRNERGAAEGASIRAAASTQTLGGQTPLTTSQSAGWKITVMGHESVDR